MLQRAATRPVHAYLLVGPRGSGIETAARCFAALLIGADGDDRVLRGRHPDVVEFRPVATMYSVERDVRDAILPAVHASPIESERKCVVLLEADRLEPASRRTRCSRASRSRRRARSSSWSRVRGRDPRHDPVALPADRLRRARHRGAARRSSSAARSPRRGRGSRPRWPVVGSTARSALAGPLAGLARRVRRRPRAHRRQRRDRGRAGRGLGEVIKDTLAGLEAGQETELDGARRRRSSTGSTQPRTASAMRKRVTDRQKREARRARTDALLEGITAIESVYRDALAGRRADAQRRSRAARGPAGRRGRRVRRLPGGPGRVRVQPERGPAPGAAAAPSPGRRGRARLARLLGFRRDSSVGRAAHS